MSELQKKIEKAIMRFKSFEPEEGYWLGYSGGKDSDCIKILAELANVKYECVHSLTTVDAPETVQYIKSQKDIKIEIPNESMWQLIVRKGMPPTRLVRYCCGEFKECGGKGRLVVTGVRWAESNQRQENGGMVKVLTKPKTNQKLAEKLGVEHTVTKQGGLIMNLDNDASRRMVEQCYRTSKTMLNPIIDFTDDEVWTVLKHYGVEGNPLYQCGFERVGCIGCPMGNRYTAFERYPKYRMNYVRAFQRMLEKRIADGKSVLSNWRDGESVMRWWLGEDSKK